jgi:arsenate reductase
MLYGKGTCSTCRAAKAFLGAKGIVHEWRDYGGDRFTRAELDTLIGTRPFAEFINPRSTSYRALGLADRSLSRDDALRLILSDPNLLKRPLLVRGKLYVFGFDKAAYAKL